MSTKNNEYQVLSMIDIVKIIIKRYKLFLSILIAGIFISFFAFIFKKDNYSFSYYLSIPEYFSSTISSDKDSNSSYTGIINNTQLLSYLNVYLKSYLQSNAQNDHYVKNIEQNIVKGSSLIKVSTKGDRSNKKLVEDALTNYVNYLKINIQKNIISRFEESLSIRKGQLNSQYDNLSQLEEKLDKQNNELKSSLKTQKPASDIDTLSQTTIQSNAYLVLALKDFQLQNELTNINEQLATINTTQNSISNLKIQSPLLQSEKALGISKTVVLILGLLLSICIAFGGTVMVDLVSDGFSRSIN